MSAERPRRRIIPSTRLNFDSRQLDNGTHRQFALADFVDHESTAIVPMNWLTSDDDGMFCWWPLQYSRSELRKALHDGEEPDESRWTRYRAVIRYEGKYDKCLKREKKLIEQGSSALSSGTESTSQRKEPGNANGKNCPPSPSATPSNSSASSTQSHSTASAVVSNGLYPVVQLQRTTIPHQTIPHCFRQSRSENSLLHESTSEQNAHDIESNHEAEPGLLRPCQSCRNAFDCPTCQSREKANLKFQQKMFRMLIQMRMEIQTTTQARRARVEPFKIGDIQIPLKSIGDIKAIELLLTPEMIAKLQEHLQYNKDDKLWDTALRMMTSIFTVRVMRQLNWEGRNRGKQGLKKLAPKLTEAILDGAKAAVGDVWTVGQLRQKLRIVLVKATRLPLEKTIDPVEAEGVDNDHQGEEEMLANFADDGAIDDNEAERPPPSPTQ